MDKLKALVMQAAEHLAESELLEENGWTQEGEK